MHLLRRRYLALNRSIGNVGGSPRLEAAHLVELVYNVSSWCSRDRRPFTIGTTYHMLAVADEILQAKCTEWERSFPIFIARRSRLELRLYQIQDHFLCYSA